MNKSLSFLMVICSVILTGCYPCRFGDWNCNASIEDTPSYQKFLQCNRSQQLIAKEKLKDRYNNKIDSEVYNNCITNSTYKFINDKQYQ